ncbi:hypothetical protein ACLZX5_00110 [Enterococcus faecium]
MEKKEDLLNAFKKLDEKDQLKALLRLHDITYSDIAERLTVKKGERAGQKGVSLVTVQKLSNQRPTWRVIAGKKL